MDVMKDNFNTLLPEIKNSIDKSNFIAIDTEFTGLSNGPDITVYDLPDDYYAKLRVGKMDYLLIQVGLCMFTYNKWNNSFSHKAYNFFIFPQHLKFRSTLNFLCEASTLSFLSSNGFDFNKLIKEGIPYLSYTDEEELRNELENRYKRSNDIDNANKVAIPDDQVIIIEDICKRIEDYLNSANMEELILEEQYNRFVRKLIYQTAYERFPNFSFSIETRMVDSKAAYLVIKKGKSKTEQRKEDYLKECEEINTSVGFSKVIRYLSESKKLIVGHNMLLDVCHLINRFYVSLPENYKEFKSLVNTVFPKMIDTKYMCNAYPFRDIIQSSVLEHLLTRLHEPPFNFIEAEECELGNGYNFNTKKSHQAGYDAYVTGCAFITMTTFLGKNDFSKIYPDVADSNILKQYRNRIHLMRLYDNAFINFKGEDVIPQKRDHVFHLTFPKQWITTNITKLFEPYGSVHVSYCSSTSAWITLYDQEKSAVVMDELVNCKSNTPSLMEYQKEYTVISWHQYQDKCKQKSSRASENDRRYIKLLSNLKRRQTDPTNSNGKRNKRDLLEVSSSEQEGDADLSTSSNLVVKLDAADSSNGRSSEVLSEEVREFLLTDIINENAADECSGQQRTHESTNKKTGNSNGGDYLKNLEKIADLNKNTAADLFEEPNWGS